MVFCSYLILLLFLADRTGLRLISCAHVQHFRYKTAVSFSIVFSCREQAWQASPHPFPFAVRAARTTALLQVCDGCGPAPGKVQTGQKPSSLRGALVRKGHTNALMALKGREGLGRSSIKGYIHSSVGDPLGASIL